MTRLFLATVLGRAIVLVFFRVFVLFGWAGWPLALFGAIDAAGALWTWQALNQSSHAA